MEHQGQVERDEEIKILINTAFRGNLVCVNLYDWLWEELSKIADVKYWGLGRPGFIHESLEATVKRLYGSDSPDWIICTPYMFEEGDRWLGWKAPPQNQRSWRIAAFTSDIHANHLLRCDASGYMNALNEGGFDTVLMLYTHLAYSKKPVREIVSDYYLRHLKARVFHCPPWADPAVFKPSAEPPLYDVCFMGAADPRQHPIRTDVWAKLPLLSQMNRWRILLKARPPGKSDVRDIDAMRARGYLVGDAYAKALSRSRVFIFDNSIYGYPLLKIVEGWMAGTCVMCDRPLTWGRMQMVEDRNYVRINVGDWKSMLKATLDDEPTRIRIARNGYETAIRHHTTEIRARELLSFLGSA